MSGSVAAILLAAGSGTRLGAGTAKALVPLGGRPLVTWSALRLARTPGIARLVLVVPAGDGGDALRGAVEALDLDLPLSTVEGGARRRDSVLRGLAAAGDAEFVLVHDAARPFASEELIASVLGAAGRVGAAVPAIAVPDTLVREDRGRVAELIPRGEARAVQTPQGFRRSLLAEAHAAADPEWDAPDDGSMVRRLGHDVGLVPGSSENFKITWPADLARAEARLGGSDQGEARGEAMPANRVGLGWDVHPLVAERAFDLVGVRVSEEFGPQGHSDGDPLSHAVADALLGAAGLGDIGTHFPDSDPRFAGIAGPELLSEAVARVRAAGWRPTQVDAVLIVDQPKIAPHRPAIRSALARLLDVAEDAVSVKGKRTEGLGGLAGSAGVGCQCVVVLEALS